MKQLKQLLDEAERVYLKNFKNTAYYARCIFLSWYCDNAGCKFCYRSTQKNKIKSAKHARRAPWSIITEVLFCRAFGWKIEFLTGGYKILPFEEIVETAKLVSEIYGRKIWVNLGALERKELRQLLPYVEGVVASIETINPELHAKICPKKPLEPYEKLLEYAGEMGLKKSITFIAGLGEEKKDFELLKKFIETHKLDRITFYPLKPVKGTPYTKGPAAGDYVWWVAKTRTAFPEIEIIGGTTVRRVNENPEEIRLLMQAGANALTKFPATKNFNSKEAHMIEQQIKASGRKFEGTLCEIREIDGVESLNVKDSWKEKVRVKIREYAGNWKS